MKKKVLEEEPNLILRKGAVDIIVEDNVTKGVVTRTGAAYYGKQLVLATGTYLRVEFSWGR